MLLYAFHRSSASFRARIGLNYKGLPYRIQPVKLSGEQDGAAYRAVNPQGRVPALRLDDGTVITQSMAILEYLEEAHPEPPLLPKGAAARALVRSLAMTIAADLQPLNNTSVLNRLREQFGAGDDAVGSWYRHWIGVVFAALEARLAGGRHCVGDAPTLADVCLVPQVYNARLYEVDLAPFPKIVAIDAHCAALPAFAAAFPEKQPDAV